MQDPACHLFAYAIPNDSALQEIGRHAPIIEVGAGTGYWAKLLRAQGVEIKAFDKALSDNEYHGNIPAFTKVQRGGAANVRRYRDHTLFLCYPPPDDGMAIACLQAYTGEVFLYVGEWRGNTGTREFEQLLLQEWSLEKRVKLPNWGSEANVLMVWRRRLEPSTAHELHCHRLGCKNAATKRCRLCRECAYCSESCMVKCLDIHNRLHATKLLPFVGNGPSQWDSPQFDALATITELASTME